MTSKYSSSGRKPSFNAPAKCRFCREVILTPAKRSLLVISSDEVVINVLNSSPDINCRLKSHACTAKKAKVDEVRVLIVYYYRVQNTYRVYIYICGSQVGAAIHQN